MKKLLILLFSLASLTSSAQVILLNKKGNSEPYLNAGVDLTITTLDSILVSARTRNLDSTVWRTDGTGTFTDTTAKRTYYTPSEADLAQDSVIISLVGFAFSGQDTIYSTKKITVNYTADPPSVVNVVWVDDFARITFVDNTQNLSRHQIWEAVGDGEYSLVTTLSAGDTSYDNYTWQNASMNFKIRAVSDYDTSLYSTIANIKTPLVWKTNQTTLNQAKFNNLNINANDTVTVNWGDGTHDHYFGTNTDVTHTYKATQNPYYVQLSGDISMGGLVNTVNQIYCSSWTSCYGDISKWKIPTSLMSIYFVGSGINRMSGDCVSLITHPAMKYCTMNSCNLSGDLSTANLTTTMLQLTLSNNPLITTLPRGNYTSLTNFVFRDCSVSTADIQLWLAYLDTYFDTHAPTKNAVYDVSYSRMGIVQQSDSDLMAVISHYTDLSKTCTIATYVPVVAYSDRSTKVEVPFTTPDGYDENVHPSALDVGVAGWNGYRYWMANTPYHNADIQYEKPCIWASNDGDTWVVPAGVTNPIINAIHADVDLFFQNDTMYISYLGNTGVVLMSYSTNGITWGGEVTIATSAGDAVGAVSPSIVKVGSTYYMYYVDNVSPSARYIRRKSCTKINGTYANPEDITLLNKGVDRWWHLDVLMIDDTYWMCVSVGSGIYLFMAKSADGLTFSRDADVDPPIISSLDTESGFYKPTMMYIGSQLYVWYSCYYNNLFTIFRINVYIL